MPMGVAPGEGREVAEAWSSLGLAAWQPGSDIYRHRGRDTVGCT